MEKIKIRLLIILLFILTSVFLFLPLIASASKMTHKVMKGDTLWDICEEYYGDNSLWPKLWQMNSFITNPHLLIPGDEITLFENIPIKAPVKLKPKPIEIPVEEPEPPIMGIGLEGIANINKLGFYSTKKIIPWGKLFATDNQHRILQANDIIYVVFEKNKKVAIGDEFTIGRQSSPIIHPVYNKKSGHLFNTTGKLVIEGKSGLIKKNNKLIKKENIYQAKIIEAYVPVEINDEVIPYKKIPTCILPIPNSTDILANIVAAQGNRSLISPHSIIYMDKGSKHGIKTGNVFEILLDNIVEDPNPEKRLLSFRKQNVILPDRFLGRILVIATYPDSASALVLSATEPVEPGAHLKSVSWVETPDFILYKANCQIQ